MSRKRGIPSAPSDPGAPTWMLTYADTVTLLMTFFVMLMGFSSMSNEDVGRLRGPLNAYLGVASQDMCNNDAVSAARILQSSQLYNEGYESVPENDPLLNVRGKVSLALEDSSAANRLQWRLTAEGLEIEVSAQTIFEPRGARIIPEGERVLRIIAAAVGGLPNDLRVEARGAARSASRELALTRTANVCRYLSRYGGIADGRLRAGAAAEEKAGADWLRPPELRLTVLRLPKRSLNL